MMAFEVGDPAPQFSLPATYAERISLKDYLGKFVVLYFYPKDMTSGCTVEACDFRDASVEMKKLGAVVLGISPDSVASHQKFTEKEHLNFPLLADEDHAVADAYGVWVEKSMYGNKYWGVERATFLINPEGEIARIWRKVKVPKHIDEVVGALYDLV
jgi:thioredoxin-dependent peroxiredoxin